MKLEYENGTLVVENADGLYWKHMNVEKPKFGFNYDALSVDAEHAALRLGSNIKTLAEDEVEQVLAYIRQIKPPESAFQEKIIKDLKLFTHGLINSVVTQLDYNGLLDVMITGREGSSDLYAEEARNVMAYIDSAWNAFYGLAAQIRNTSKAELKDVKEYAETMPFPPQTDYFSRTVHQELFNGAHDGR